jgi:hypothetical protein
MGHVKRGPGRVELLASYQLNILFLSLSLYLLLSRSLAKKKYFEERISNENVGRCLDKAHYFSQEKKINKTRVALSFVLMMHVTFYIARGGP